MADISKVKLPDGSVYDIKDAKALPKTTYEYNKEISFGGSGKLLIGKFKCYDSNVTIEINSTTATTYHAVAILATQNINTSHGGSMTWNVYGDDSNTVASNLYLYYPSNSQWIEIYFSPSSWSKNLIHIQCMGIQAEATNVCENVSAIPETATVKPTNISRGAYVLKAGDTMTGALAVDGFNIKRTMIPTNTYCVVGWYRIAKIYSATDATKGGYPNFLLFYGGRYNNSNPSNWIVSINANYTVAYLNQLNGYLNGCFSKVRLVKISNGSYYVDAYQNADAPTKTLGYQHFTFIGMGTVETYSPTAPLETEETAVASIDIATNRIVSDVVGNVSGRANGLEINSVTGATVDDFRGDSLRHAKISSYTDVGLAGNDGCIIWVPYSDKYGRQFLLDDTGYLIKSRCYSNGNWSSWNELAFKDKASANTLMNTLDTGSSTPVDADYYISQYVGGGTSTTTYHRRPMSALWEYIKGKISSILGLTASNYGGTSAKATADASGNTITTYYAPKSTVVTNVALATNKITKTINGTTTDVVTAATTSGYGITKLSTATNSTAVDVAATPSAVKTAYDLANSANTTANTALSGVNGNLIYDQTFTISNGVATFTPHVYQKGAEVTTNYAASCFKWKYRLIDGSEVSLTTNSNRGCTVTISGMGYGGHVIGIFTPA